MRGRSSLNWDDLRYFLGAARARSLSGAARGLGVEHTTIGRRLTALERALGASLILRGPDGLRLTPLGQRIFPLVEGLERGIASISDIVSASASRVRLSMPSGFAAQLGGMLDDLRRAHPQLALELSSGERLADLEAGEVDLCIRVGPIAQENLIARRICDVGFSLYASEAYLARRGRPASPFDLSGHELVGYDMTLVASTPARWIEAHCGGAPVVYRAREMTDIMSAAAGGVGVALLPCIMGDADPALRRLFPTVVASSPVSVVYARDARNSPSVRTVSRFVIGSIRSRSRLFAGEPQGVEPPERQAAE